MQLQHDTRVGKTLHGDWQAETRYHIHGTRVLMLITSKDTDRNGRATGISTLAKGGTVDGAFIAHRACIGQGWGDYRRTVVVEPGKRATEKSVREVHEKALAGIEALLAEVREFYEAQPAEGAAA